MRVVPARTLQAVVISVSVACLLLAARPVSQGSDSTYTLYTPQGQRSIPFRASGDADLVKLDQLASAFNFALTEDTLVGGLIVRTSGQTILLIPGQSFASIGPGRIVSLPAPIQRDRNDEWEVPVEFIRQAIGPALGQPVEIRPASHVILFGDVRLPRVTGRGEAQGRNYRVVVDVEPAAPHTIERTGDRLSIRFDAVRLEYTPIANLTPEFVTAAAIDGSTLFLTLGPETTGYRVDDSTPTRLVIDLMGPPPPPPTPPVASAGAGPPETPAPVAPGSGPATSAPRPALDLSPPGTIRTVVIDPGHGGEDTGARGPRGASEKDIVLRLARQLRSAIEGRIGLRVLLTRDGDAEVPLDRRASLANNNKADLFISLHTNASVRPSVGGAQVLSLSLDEYRSQMRAFESQPIAVPALGGGTRLIDVVPWDLAQIPNADRSATVAAILRRRLSDQGVPIFSGTTPRMPLRTLVGANMPAIMIEVGFLSNAADAQALVSDERAGRVVEAVVTTLNEIRGGVRVPDAQNR